MKKLSLFLMILFLCFVAMDLYAQCPMCKTSLEEARKEGTQVGSTLNTGILYLLALPYSIASIFGIIWWRKSRRHQQSH